MFRFWPRDVTPQQCAGCGSELSALRSRPIRVHAVSGAPRLTPLTESPARSLETRFPGDILRGRCCVFGVSHGPPRQLKGFLRLSLVTCPVALYPATSDTEKVSFNQVNRKTGHRIKY